MADATTPSCLDCPSYLPPADAAAFFGKSINAPMCARFGHVLERPESTNAQNSATLVSYASACSKWGEGRPVRQPDRPSTTVFLPDPAAREELSDLDPKRNMVRSCVQCRNFVPDAIVQAEHGWAAGACQAKGNLILANRRVKEATGCTFRQVGAQPSTVNLMMLPAYRTVDAAREAVLERAADSIIEPSEYVSDKDVTDEEVELGIRAWRKIDDADGTGNFIYLPIFDAASFAKEDQALIPKTGSKEAPELYFDHNNSIYRIGALWMELDETPALWSAPGLGKTEIFRHLAWLMNVPFYRFSIKESTELYELEGTKELNPEGTFFRDGRFTRAWASRCVIVVDEPNMGRPEVWAFLRPCMDNSKQLVLDSDGGRAVTRNDFAFLGLAMNPAWNPTNVGTSPIGAADASRLMHLEFSYPEESVERKIIENRVKIDGWKIDKPRLDMVMAISNNIRELIGQGALPVDWGIRENIKAARSLRWFDPLSSYRMALADFLEPEQKESILDQVRACMPSGRFPAVQILGEEA